MRAALIGFLFLMGPAIVVAACGQDSVSAATSSSSGSTGGAPSCEGVYIVYGDKDGGHPCDLCLYDNCCAELANCRDKSCIDCVNTLWPSCGPEPRAVDDCLYRYCQPICSPGWPPTSTSVGGSGG